MSTATAITIEERESALHPHGLRRLADALERAPFPGSVHAGVKGSGSLDIAVFTYGMDDLREARRIVGHCEKEERPGGGGVILKGRLDGIPVTIYPPSGACRRVQVGAERRPVVKTVETDEYEEVPVYEWDCGPLLAEADES